MGRVVTSTIKQAVAKGRIDELRVDATTDEDVRRQMIEDGEYPDADHDDWYAGSEVAETNAGGPCGR